MRGKPVPSKRKQRGSIIMAAGSLSTTATGVVVLTAHTVFDEHILSATDAAIRFDNDGGLHGIRTIEANETYTGEWWSDEAEADIGDSYEVRALSTGKSGTWTTSAATDDIWVTLTSNKTWGVSAPGLGFKQTSATFEVGLDGVESALDSATITCVADSGGA